MLIVLASCHHNTNRGRIIKVGGLEAGKAKQLLSAKPERFQQISSSHESNSLAALLQRSKKQVEDESVKQEEIRALLQRLGAQQHLDQTHLMEEIQNIREDNSHRENG